MVVDPNHVLPRTYEWNVAFEKSLSSADVFTLTYASAGGRKLMRHDLYEHPNSNFTGEFDVLSNAATSNYSALEAEYQHAYHTVFRPFSRTPGATPLMTLPVTEIS